MMLFEHNCENCEYLGSTDRADLYFCRQSGNVPTVLARYSDDGENYSSGFTLSYGINPDVTLARIMAEALGLVSRDDAWLHAPKALKAPTSPP